jgi:hypothetical protein
MEINISVAPRSVAVLLTAIILLLMVASVSASLLNYQVATDNPLLVEVIESLTRLWFLDYEANIPTWFSSSILLMAALLLGVIAVAKRRLSDPFALQWGILAALFLYLSLDEAAIIHEMAIMPLRMAFQLGGIFYYGWVIPALVAVLILLWLYRKFLSHLPPPTRIGFIIAGVVYVGGAVGVEVISGLYAEQYGEVGIVYDLIITCEEVLEMLGIVLFIYALLSYLSHSRMILKLSFACVYSIPANGDQL